MSAVERKTVNVRVRRKVNPQTNGGRLPSKNLPDIHTDELIVRTPPLPTILKEFPNAPKIWKDICGTLIHRGKLKYNHLHLVTQCTKWCSLANATPQELLRLGYTNETNFGFKPTLVSLYKTFNDEWLKCYAELTLTPKTEAYDCMLNLSAKSGMARIDVESTSEKREVVESDFDGF